MMPWDLRDLPPHRQIELMAHRREVRLRESHACHVQRMISKKTADSAPGRKRQ